MKNHTISLGDLVTSAYDQAALSSSDPREVSAIAHRTIEKLLRSAHRAAPLQRSRR